MSDEITPNEAQASADTGTTPSGATTVTTPSPVPYDRFAEVTRANAEMKKRLAAIEQAEAERTEAARKAEEARLTEQNEFKALYEKRTAEIAAITPKAQQADELLALITEQNQSKIDELSEDLRTLIPTDYDPVKLSRWLAANLSKLTTPKSPNLDGGRAGDRGKVPQKVELPKRNW